MKRGWIGFALLLVLLAGGLGAAWGMDRCNSPIAGTLDRAADAAMEENWSEAGQLAQKAEADWKRCWKFNACFADHEALEEIDSMLGQLEVYAKEKEEVSFASTCIALSRMIRAVGEAHGLNWKNLL